jgi:hypothetical protein
MAEKSRVKELAVRLDGLAAAVVGVVGAGVVVAEPTVVLVVLWVLLPQALATSPAPSTSADMARLLITTGFSL